MLNTRFTQSRATFERLLAAATARPTRIAAGSDGAAWTGQYTAGRASIGQASYAPLPQPPQQHPSLEPQAQYLPAPAAGHQQQVYYDPAGQQPVYAPAAAATAAPASYGVAQQATGYPAPQPVYQEQQQQYQPAQPMYQEQQPSSAPPPQQQAQYAPQPAQGQYAPQPAQGQYAPQPMQQGQYGNAVYAPAPQGPPPPQQQQPVWSSDGAGYANAQPVQYSPQPMASFNTQQQPQPQQQQQQGQQQLQYAPGPGQATGYAPSASRTFAGSRCVGHAGKGRSPILARSLLGFSTATPNLIDLS